MFAIRMTQRAPSPAYYHTRSTISPHRSGGTWLSCHRKLNCTTPGMACQGGVLANIGPFYYHQGLVMPCHLRYLRSVRIQSVAKLQKLQGTLGAGRVLFDYIERIPQAWRNLHVVGYANRCTKVPCVTEQRAYNMLPRNCVLYGCIDGF